MIKPFQQDAAFLADVASAVQSEPDRLHLWWLGQSGYLVYWDGAYALLDPYLSDSLTRKYANTAKPHVRMTERVIAPEHLSMARVVTSSHNHTDHLDAETIGPLLAANPALTVIASWANVAFAAERLQVAPERITGITLDRQVDVAPFRFHALQAAHNKFEQDAAGHHCFIGLIVEAGPYRIYHSGDTLRYPGLEARLRPWRVDIALLPLNGDDPARGVAGNLDGPQAAQLAHDIGAGLVVPCHYEMYAFNTADTAPFCAEAERLGQPVHVLRGGERLTAARKSI